MEGGPDNPGYIGRHPDGTCYGLGYKYVLPQAFEYVAAGSPVVQQQSHGRLYVASPDGGEGLTYELDLAGPEDMYYETATKLIWVLSELPRDREFGQFDFSTHPEQGGDKRSSAN